MNIRFEKESDYDSISSLTRIAFEGLYKRMNWDFSKLNEDKLINGLRKKGALSLSLVTEDDNGNIIGHIALSKITINGKFINWYGLGPISVSPDHQRKGIGSAMIKRAFEELKKMNGEGVVLTGDPNFYTRFGFQHVDSLHYGKDQFTRDHFFAYSFDGNYPTGDVEFDELFEMVE